jgi:hypothetical protein
MMTATEQLMKAAQSVNALMGKLEVATQEFQQEQQE